MVEENTTEKVEDNIIETDEEDNTTSSHIDRAEKAADNMRIEREKLEATIGEMKSIQSEEAFRKRLGGVSEAGGKEPKEEEVSNVEYAKQALEGKLNG